MKQIYGMKIYAYTVICVYIWDTIPDRFPIAGVFSHWETKTITGSYLCTFKAIVVIIISILILHNFVPKNHHQQPHPVHISS